MHKFIESFDLYLTFYLCHIKGFLKLIIRIDRCIYNALLIYSKKDNFLIFLKEAVSIKKNYLGLFG